MDLGSSRRYEIELWSSSGLRIADISAFCFNRRYTMQRNEAETLTFDVNLYAFEKYCLNNLGGIDPKTLIAPYVTDVKVKRNGLYLFGTQVVDVNFDLAQDMSRAGESGGGAAATTQDQKVSITATGYLNLLKDRYVTKTYAATERTAIATDLITTTQAQTNGSVGITISGSQYLTTQLSDRTYQLDEVKNKIQEMAALSDSPFDFDFSPLKAFRTYAKIGARRQDINLIYGGALGNVAGFALDRSAINLFNKIYGIGSGFGTSQLTSTAGDNASQLNYYLREQIQQFNSVLLQPTLDQNTSTALSLEKDILELPVVTITGKEIPATFLSVGDRIPLKVMTHKWLDNINGLYRIEQIDVTIDENDFESAIKLTFDSYGVNQSE
ncbi:hypothetical protein QN355_19290 [Cryobacterium sp. 10S3]|uniref:hypothetical protein n=1 Tax=Cryobacterium sp. 10S3 TaxID=3048582 RepID=UPI002AC95EE0|nr:hypothetical protein [Cryobacterium sp. 10S3]MEB0288678.1 hypothetical protein [Cryobacterium sp. 10S3]WPX14192.1 hypothetical protein RHM57_02115 [Cryobacterium sp. 10S3]